MSILVMSSLRARICSSILIRKYCRTVCRPRLSDSAATLLQESYVKIRQLCADIWLVRKAETQIKRRMGIGSHISERRLIDELARMGINDSIVRRALIIMHQRDEVEYKRERRVILRKA
ncbi:hypothetical protein POM88_052865 [Heracleum sosnowskyi]|uniref:MCM5 C-terminal domain-containing protein n=1 Tax=Heracleum sosnowskyi TaxID=360622 RepID=A0AAD8LYE6_9APIA|nr:hypothetical protein POM88_052865 [Heracleum sosnowskyi]